MGKKAKLCFKWTMHRMILALCILTTLLALVLLTILFQISSERQIREESIKENAETMTRMQEEFASRIHGISTEMLSVYSNTDLITNLKHWATPDGRNLRQFYFTAEDIAGSKFDTEDKLAALYIYDRADQIVSNYRKSVQYYPNDIYTEDNESLEEVRDYLTSDDTDPFITGYYSDAADSAIVRVVLKLHDYDEKKEVFGYLVCDFQADIFTDIIQKYIPAHDVYLWLQADGRNPVMHSGELSPETAAYVERISVQMRGSHLEELAEEYGDYYFSISSGKADGLYALMLTPRSLILATQRSLMHTLLVISLLMIGLTLFLGSVFSKYLSKPLEEMQHTITRIGQGETQLRLSPDRWSLELELLGNEFNRMLDRIQVLAREESEARVLAERTRYKMLQAQINPHFLYNTLDTMSGIANSQDCVMVSGLCQSLSAIFRYCLNMSDSLPTLQQEMAHVRNYLYVMDVRSESEVSVEYAIDPDTLGDALPRLTLQPIVENALTHGLRNIRKGEQKEKKLRIEAHHIENTLEVRITDNGTGMDAAAMNEALEKNEASRVEIGQSIGILNVNARLKSLFGDLCGIRVESTVGEGTTVILTVLVQKEGSKQTA